MSTQPDSITIDLSKSSNASSFKSVNFIHQKELKKVKALVDQRLEQLKKTDTDNNSIQQDAITILGSRGSGKTSFLKTLYHDLHSKEDGTKEEYEDISVIDIIDPTMIEQKGHVFLTIISQIRKIVDKKLDADCAQLPCRKKEWDDCLHKLSAGLPTLDGISDGANMEAWQDPEYIMNRGLEKVDSAINLAQNFRKLIQKALEIVHKKVFVLLLDDIDIDFCIGWPVLETVRKYLIFPEIITIVSGDMQLFTKAIRKKQWKNFGKALLKNEGELLGRVDSYNDLVTKMESQYLQKVLKPQLRQRLTTLLEKYQAEPTPSIKIGTKELIDLYKEILNSYGIRNGVQLECYRSFLLNLPLRTQIQFLIKFSDVKIDKEYPDDVHDVFLSDLYEKEINVDLAVSMPKYLYVVILKTLVDNKVLNDAYQLQPITLDESLNGSLMALALLSSTQNRKNPFLVFDYFVRVGYIRNLWSALGYEESRNNEPVMKKLRQSRRTEMLAPSIEGLIAHAALYQDRNSRDTVCMATAYLRAAMNTQLGKESFIPYGGTVCLYGTANKARKPTKEEEKKIDELGPIALIPASISQSNAKQGGLVTYSVYALFGTIAELLRICLIRHKANDSQTIEENNTKSEKAKQEHRQIVEKALGEMSQLRTFPMPGMMPYGDYPIVDDVDQTGNNSKDNDKREEAISEWAEKILTWADQYPKKSISPHLLGKISTRAFYAMDSIDKSTTPGNLGEYMHQHLIAFMNAVLVEDVRENIVEGLVLSNDNPRDKDNLFIDNLKKVNDLDAIVPVSLPFSHWMLACPLLLCFLNFEELKPEMERFGIQQPTILVEELTLYQRLNHVSIKIASNYDKPQFYYSKKNMSKTIDVLKVTMPYSDIKSHNISSVIAKLKQIFKGEINENGVSKVRSYLIDNDDITW